MTKEDEEWMNAPMGTPKQQPLAGEQPECETCGNSGIKPFTKFYYCVRCNKDVSEDHLVTLYRNKPKDRCPICKNKVVEKSTCPDCQQPPAGELLPWEHRLAEEYDRKQFLEMIERYNQKLSGVWDDDFTIKGSELLTIISLGWGAIFRLDRAEAINKDLLTACEMAENWIRSRIVAINRPAKLDKALMDAIDKAHKGKKHGGCRPEE